MSYKDLFISIADILEAKFKGSKYKSQNPADRGEICELFIQDFIKSSLGDNFKINRGGKIIDYTGNQSSQIDIIITGKKSLRLFEDKGLYPTETVFGVCSVTATLDKAKLMDCCKEFMTIPKDNYEFSGETFFPEDYIKDTQKCWLTLVPFKCIFAYSGTIKAEWIQEILDLSRNEKFQINRVPDLIVVNKIGMIEKTMTDDGNFELHFVSFSDYPNYGVAFAKFLFHMNNLTHEEFVLRPRYENYFNNDIYTTR